MARREAVKGRRVLFNADGGQLSFGPYPLSRADFAQYLFGPLEHSHVDTVLWCIGNTGNAADYPSEVVDLYGCKAAGYRFQHSGLGRNALVCTLVERGAEMTSPVRVENADVCITYV